MENKYSDEELTLLFGQDVAESEIINKRVQETYGMIRKKNRKKGKKKFNKIYVAIASAAAVLILAVGVCVANPVLAAKIPLIGRIFQLVEEKVSYHGDYSNNMEPLITNEENSEMKEDNLYSQTSNGVTFSISEFYADSMSMYLGVAITAENGFPQEMIDTAKNTDLTYEILEMDTIATADFSEAGLGKVYFDPAYGIESPYIIEGSFVDNDTFAGIIRMDLTNLVAVQEDGTLTNISAVPSHFIYELAINHIYTIGDIEEYQNQEIEKISGKWEFSLDVTLDNSQNVIKYINLTNSDGIGIGEVKRTRYEIEAELILPNDVSSTDYVVVMADANGNPLNPRGQTVGTYDIYKREVDKITIGICDAAIFMEHKGDFKELLSKTIFQTEVNFDE